MTPFVCADATDTVSRIHSGELDAKTVAEHFLSRVAALEADIHAFVEFDPQQVSLQLETLPNGPLTGVTVGIKDVFDTADWPTRYHSPIYQNHRPALDAHVVARLRQAGAIIMGKTHTTEFAYMHTGPTRNPHDLARTPGSSSAGSAAGMAAGFFQMALGTQTAGSLIKPASYCGLYAFKPSFGLVSLEGVKPLAPSFDTVGWYGGSVRDLRLMAQVLIPGFPVVPPGSGRPRLGFCRTARWHQVEPGIAKALADAVEKLRAAGFPVMEVVLPEAFDTVFDDHLLINDCEGSRSLSKERHAHGGLLSPEVLAMMDRAASTSWDQETAAKARLMKLRPILQALCEPFDALLGASCGIVAPLGLGSTGPSDFCKFWMAFGLPQLNLPLERSSCDLPAGLQMIGQFRGDSALLSIAEQVDRALRG